MNVKTRPATLKDLEVLLGFEQGVIKFERQFDKTLKPHKTHYYNIPQLITAKHIQFIVAEYQGKIISCGYARITTSKPYLKHEQHAYLGFMFVTPNFRGKGVNKLIIEALKKWIISQNIFELRLEVYYNNIGAIKAYEKAGFKKHMIEMRLGDSFE